MIHKILYFAPAPTPPAPNPRGEVFDFPLRRVVYEDTMRPVNPLAALCGAALAVFAGMFVVVVSVLVW